MLCLRLIATLEGISSARRLAVLCKRDIAYQWICGGAGVNRDLLNTLCASACAGSIVESPPGPPPQQT
jgi:transposase